MNRPFHAETNASLSFQRAPLAVALVATFLSGAPSFAQDASQTSVLEEILVTAQKREQSLLETPLSLQAFDADLIARERLRDVRELMNFVPGASELPSDSLGRTVFQLRGISQSPSSDPTIGYYVDDAAYFYFSSNNQAPIGRTYDMQRVEVLRGPQSTLYGNGSMGGTIRFITEEPNLEEFEASVRTGYYDTSGGDDSYYLDGAVSVPVIKDKLAFRFTGSYEDVGGYVEEITGAENVDSGELQNWRASVLATPTERLRIRATFLRDSADQERGTTLGSFDPPISLSTGEGNFWETEVDLAYVTVEYDLGFATFSSTFTDIDAYGLGATSTDIGPGLPPVTVAGVENSESFSNETRLVSSGDGPLNWVAGVFYSENDLRIDSIGSTFGVASADQISEALSVFGELSYELMGGKLIPLIGLRYFEDDRTADIVFNGLSLQDEGDTFESVNPRFNLSYLPDENSQYFINIAKGFRSGRFNNPGSCLAAGFVGLPCELSLDSDELWSYELGVKKVAMGGQLLIDAAVYYQDWQDYRDAIPTGLGVSYFGIVGDAELYGLDVGLQYAPASIEGLSLSATGNWNSSEFSDVDPVSGAAAAVSEGDRIPYVPEWTLALTGSYEWTISGAWSGIASATYSKIGEAAGQLSTGLVTEGRDLLRARIGADSERFGVFLYGVNLLNEDEPITVRAPFGPAVPVFSQDRPRQVGVEVEVRF